MQVFDASSMILAWDNYPLEQFPGLRDWLADEIEAQRLKIPRPILDEIAHKAPECSAWLKQHEVEPLNTTNEIIQEAFRIMKLLGIVDAKYHSKGVDENDLLVIASASILSGEVVSEEGRQAIRPNEPTRMKIPAVCALPEVSVQCINFVEYLKRGGAVFR